MIGNLKTRNKGITLIEILLGLGVLVVLISFAAPSISGANSSMQLRAASEQFEYSIDMARNTARMTESPVFLNISDDAENGQQRVSFTLSERARKKLSQPDLPEFILDENLVIQSDHLAFEFDGRGIVTNPGTVTLIVKNSEDNRSSFILE